MRTTDEPYAIRINAYTRYQSICNSIQFYMCSHCGLHCSSFNPKKKYKFSKIVRWEKINNHFYAIVYGSFGSSLDKSITRILMHLLFAWAFHCIKRGKCHFRILYNIRTKNIYCFFSLFHRPSVNGHCTFGLRI